MNLNFGAFVLVSYWNKIRLLKTTRLYVCISIFTSLCLILGHIYVFLILSEFSNSWKP